MEKNLKKNVLYVCIYIKNSICCKSETNTTLYINYISVLTESFKIHVDNCLVCKSQSHLPETSECLWSGCWHEVQAGAFWARPSRLVCRGCSRAAGWGSGERGLLGSLSPGSPGAEMRISDSLTLDLCRCCTRVFGSASHPSISSPGHPVTGDMEQAVQGLGREVTRHTNDLQHPLLEKKKTMKKSRFTVCRSEEEAFCNLRNFRPWCLLFSALGTCSLSPGWMQLALTTFSFLIADSSQPSPLPVFNPKSIAEIN